MSDNFVKCIYSLFCKHCEIEADGLITLHSIHSGNLTVAEFPIKIPLCFVFFLELDLNRYKQSDEKGINVRIIVNSPWGQTIGEMRPATPFVEVSPDKAVCNVSVPYGETMFWQAGEYTFEVFVNNSLLRTTTLNLSEQIGKRE